MKKKSQQNDPKSVDRGSIPKKSSDRGSIPKESYSFPLISKGERMRRCMETKRKIRGIKIVGVMFTEGA
jgi:hypothetical protein